MLRQYESSAAVRGSIDRLVGEIADDRQRHALGFGTAVKPRGASETLGSSRLEEAAMQSLTRTLDRLEQKD
jgi:RNase P protein component